MKTFNTIFYSWQSDLAKETNLNAIRHCLREASSLIETEFEDIRVDVDEATRDTTGSPNIPQTIFGKILLSDIFICDLTTINTLAPPEFRRVPNPNVLIELGYAIAILGWERIIMLFNTTHGTFPNDLPFDIDRHRATPFSVKGKNDKDEKSKLITVLKAAVQAIIINNPLKPEEKRKETPQQKKRKIDVSNLIWIMNNIHIPTFDLFLSEIPETIIRSIFFYKDRVESIINSSSFHIYDQQLFEYLREFEKCWQKSLSFYQHYGPDGPGKNYKFHIIMDEFQTEQSEKDFYELVKIKQELEIKFKTLLNFIRNNYMEVDLEQTNKVAYNSYKEYIKI